MHCAGKFQLFYSEVAYQKSGKNKWPVSSSQLSAQYVFLHYIIFKYNSFIEQTLKLTRYGKPTMKKKTSSVTITKPLLIGKSTSETCVKKYNFSIKQENRYEKKL